MSVGIKLLKSVEAGTPKTERSEGLPPRPLRKTTDPLHRAYSGVDQYDSIAQDENPLTVREAAKFLGVSPQTVYLWVERKQIPHLRVMGRNIRFLRSELGTFRASFKQEMENAKST